MDNALTFLGYANITDPNYTWLKASYMSQILDFSDIVRRKPGIDGLIDALNIYGTGFFNSTAVGAIVQSGKTIGKYFADKLSAGQSTDRTLPDSQVVKQVEVKNGEGNTVANVFFVEKQDGATFYWDVVGVEYLTDDGTYLSYGSLGVDSYAKLGFTDAELYSIFDSDIQFQRIENGEQTFAELKDSQGNTLLVIEPTITGGYNFYNSYGDYVDAKINAIFLGYNISLSGGLLEKYSSSYASWFTEEQRTYLRLMGYSDNEIDMILSEVDLVVDEDGNPTFNYSINSTAQKLFNIASAAGQDWLSLIKADIDLFYKVGEKLWDEKYYTNNTKVLYNTLERFGTVDMKLEILDTFEHLGDVTRPLIGWAAWGWRLGNENSLWDMSIRDAAPEVTKLVDEKGMKFVYVPGNMTEADLSEVRLMRDLLGTDKTVVVGWSAGTEAVVRSWAATKDKNVYYMLVSPRMTAGAINAYATAAGIDPSKILIVNAKGDLPDYSWGYGNGAPYNPRPWTHVFLIEDTTTPDNTNDRLLGHSGPIDGWLNNHEYASILNGSAQQEKQLLTDIYKKFLNGELWQN